MTRPLSVLKGGCLVVTLWIWTVKISSEVGADGWAGMLIIFCNLIVAMLITGPLYREYLK